MTTIIRNRMAMPAGRDDVMNGLTMRERDVLASMAQGLSNAGIGHRLYLSPRTVEVHVGSIFDKLGLTPERTENQRVRAVVTWLLSSSAVMSQDHDHG